MKTVHLAEIRHLRPHLRLAMLEGRVKYRDQKENVQVVDEDVKKLQYSGQLQSRGGQSEAANDPALFVHDTLVRAPHLSSER